MLIVLRKAAGLEVTAAAKLFSAAHSGYPLPAPSMSASPKGGPLSSFNVLHPVDPSTTEVEDPSPTPSVRLPEQLLDLVCEAVLTQADETARGAVAAHLIGEIHHCLGWLHPNPSHPERVSFQRVVDEVGAYQAELAAPTSC
jgi:hypothetical protein